MSVWPVTQPASLDAKNTAARAMSSGWAMRTRGRRDTSHPVFNKLARSNSCVARVSGISLGPLILVHQLQPELNNAGQVALRVHRAELRIAERGVRRREARTVRDVEHLGTELKIEPVLELGILGECHIDLRRSVASATVEGARRSAERVRSGVGKDAAIK